MFGLTRGISSRNIYTYIYAYIYIYIYIYSINLDLDPELDLDLWLYLSIYIYTPGGAGVALPRSCGMRSRNIITYIYFIYHMYMYGICTYIHIETYTHITLYEFIHTHISNSLASRRLGWSSSELTRVNPMHIYHMHIQISARCPLFSSLDRANDYAHSPIVAPLSPPRLSCALRPTQMHKVPSHTLGCRWYALRSLSSLSLSSALRRRHAAAERMR